jgi:DNA polymerase-3 subunit epsilon
MSWLGRLFGKLPRLPITQQASLDRFQALPRCDASTLLSACRFVVLDVETTGLNLFSDRLIAIGAVTVTNGLLELGQGFEVVLQQNTPSSVENILIHGIGGTEQITGRDPAEALLLFLQFAGNSPLVAYHAEFDRTMMARATKTFLGMAIDNPWIDLALIAPALYPAIASSRRALDDWTAAFNIENTNRHNAVADALATAQLLLPLLARAQASGASRLRDLLQMEKDQRWLARQ